MEVLQTQKVSRQVGEIVWSRKWWEMSRVADLQTRGLPYHVS